MTFSANQLAAVTRTLSDWAYRLKDVAHFDIKEGTGYWRISARPTTPGTCPMTLVLRNDQKFDLALARERFEERQIDDFALFGAIADAVSAGRIELVRTLSAMTGGLKAIETRINFKDGAAWLQTRKAGPLKDLPPDGEDVQSVAALLALCPIKEHGLAHQSDY